MPMRRSELKVTGAARDMLIGIISMVIARVTPGSGVDSYEQMAMEDILRKLADYSEISRLADVTKGETQYRMHRMNALKKLNQIEALLGDEEFSEDFS